MEAIPVGQLKARFAEILATVRAGGSVIVCYGRKHENVAALVPLGRVRHNGQRQLGLLAGRATATFSEDFAISDEDFLDA